MINYKLQKLIEECLYWLIEFQATTKLNDNAWEELGNLIERCYDVVKTDD